jgi:hypothetical protein
MRDRPILLVSLATLAVAAAHAVEIDVPGLVGTHGCAPITVEVTGPGLEHPPDRAALRLEIVHTPGLHLSCVGPMYDDGADFYGMVELVEGMRADAAATLPAEAGTFEVELEFANHLWVFMGDTIPLELWLNVHPDWTYVLCDAWYECPISEIVSATLIIDPATPTSGSSWSGVRALYR